MAIIDFRDLLPFPGGSNISDTFIGGVHLNKTALDYWNYTLYSNNTLSNGSWCLLVFEPYSPVRLLPNGTFVNATWCYEPILPVGPRGDAAVGFASAFFLALLLNLTALKKHGKLYLPAEHRFRPIGRRWQWYWAVLVCAAACISLFTALDVDRYYVMELPIILTSFFWLLMESCTMALVWEAVRHWGSWKERQFVDPDPFTLRHDDRRATFEFYAPLWFYFWWWLYFFMVIPRNWGPLELQRSPDQTLAEAEPNATDPRFRAAAFMLFICWATAAVHMWHSIRHYNPRNRGVFNRSVGFVRSVPFRFALILVLALAMVAYEALAFWRWDLTPLNAKGYVPAIYVGGYLPALLILFVQALNGFLTPNEDKELLRQRRIRGAEIDHELGLVHKPAWWRRVRDGGAQLSVKDRIARNVRDIGGGQSTQRGIERALDAQAREAAAIEMATLGRADSRSADASSLRSQPLPPAGPGYTARSDRRRSELAVQAAAGLLFPSAGGPGPVDRRAELMMDGPPPPYKPPSEAASSERGRTLGVPGAGGGRDTTERSTSTGASITAPPQQVRSMLDI